MGLSWTREYDHVWGPFLYAPDRREGWRPKAITITSGGEEDGGATFRLSGFGHTFMVALPQMVCPPEKHKVFPDDWNNGTPEAAAIVARLGRNWYWQITEREFGVSLSEGHLCFKFGRQSGDSRTEKSKGFILPWTQWRFIRTSHYTPTGEHIRTFPRTDRRSGQSTWDEEYKFYTALPTVDFEFDDYDGERVVAQTRIEEREWRFGAGWFKWLSWFRKPKIRRSLDLRFTKETGERKGSWKGGTVGAGADMAPGETPETAFRRYCAAHNMKFIGPTETTQ